MGSVRTRTGLNGPAGGGGTLALPITSIADVATRNGRKSGETPTVGGLGAPMTSIADVLARYGSASAVAGVGAGLASASPFAGSVLVGGMTGGLVRITRGGTLMTG